MSEIPTSNEFLNESRIHVGNNVSDLEAKDITVLRNQFAHDDFWRAQFTALSSSPCEIQYEGPIQIRLWENFPVMLSVNNNEFLGVHQPLRDRDVISTAPDLAELSISDTFLAMDLAHRISAQYFVYHLTSQDDWQRDRAQQLTAAIAVFRRMTNYYQQNRHGYKLALEIPLEYPKHPSIEDEVPDVIQRVRDIHPESALIVDIAHHWHNQVLVPESSFDKNYRYRLAGFLLGIESKYPGMIYAFHLGGSYIVDAGHQTHAVPGRLPNGLNSRQHTLEYGFPEGFNGKWMQINDVLLALKDWAEFARSDLRIILEVNEVTSVEKKEARDSIKRRLIEFCS